MSYNVPIIAERVHGQDCPGAQNALVEWCLSWASNGRSVLTRSDARSLVRRKAEALAYVAERSLHAGHREAA